MTKKSPELGRGLLDTRGLRPDQDPRMFYVYSSQLRQQNATGLEGLLYKLIPLSMFSATAYAIDPFAKLKVGLGRVTPVNRERSEKLVSLLDHRSLNFHYSTTGRLRYYESNGVTFNGPDNESGEYDFVLPQDPFDRVSNDTTRRTRIPGSSLGEFRKTEFRISSPELRIPITTYLKVYNDTPEPFDLSLRWLEDFENIVFIYTEPAARFNPDSAELLSTEIYGRAFALAQKHAISMFKGITPQARTYTLARNIIELKDIPRSILSLKESFLALFRLSESLKIPARTRELLHSLRTVQAQVPKEYLSYWFGWRQTYKDSVELIASPSKIARRIDYLVARNGQATTFRSSRTFEEAGVPPTGFVYDTPDFSKVELRPDPTNTHRSVFLRKTELRMVVNTMFEFPPTDVPSFRENEFYRQLGVVPTPVDLYNLIPWSWLFDWFTGFGNYLEVIENINSSSELINWGLVSATVEDETHTDVIYDVERREITGTVSSPKDITLNREVRHRSTLYGSHKFRWDLATLMDVNCTSDPVTLTPYQFSILGALLSKFTEFKR